MKKDKIIKELTKYPKNELVSRILDLETKLASIAHDHQKAIKYLKLSLRRIDPDRRKLSLINELITVSFGPTKINFKRLFFIIFKKLY